MLSITYSPTLPGLVSSTLDIQVYSTAKFSYYARIRFEQSSRQGIIQVEVHCRGTLRVSRDTRLVHAQERDSIPLTPSNREIDYSGQYYC